MPESKKRKTEPKDTSKQKHYNPTDNKAGKILVLILALSMVAGLLFAAIYLMITAL